MQKRAVEFGSYNTADYGWTLNQCTLSGPEQKTRYVEKSGGDGSWDLSTALTDGVPRYKNRSLTVVLECSQGDREHREQLISEMVNTLDGYEWPIVLPDHPGRYLTGRIHVAVNYSDLAHAAVTVTGTVGPWFESEQEKLYVRAATATAQTINITNDGRRILVPQIIVAGDAASIRLEYGLSNIQLGPGTYTWPVLVLTPGLHRLTFSGTGTLTVKFREAVLR